MLKEIDTKSCIYSLQNIQLSTWQLWCNVLYVSRESQSDESGDGTMMFEGYFILEFKNRNLLQ